MKKILIVLIVIVGFCGVYVLNNKAAAPTSSDANQPTNNYTLAQVAQHATGTDCWMAIEGNVYDVTTYTSKHPKGTKYLDGCGVDATDLFNGERKHSRYLPLLETFKIGILSD